MVKSKTKGRPLELQPPTDEEIESESDPRPEEPAAKSKARKITRQRDHEDPPEPLAGADDEDGHPPGTRGRAPRKAKEDALNSRNWVETGRRKSQTDAAMAPEKPVTKVGPPKGGHAKGKGSDEIEEEPNAGEFGPVTVGSEDSSVQEDESMDELEAEFDLRRSRLASTKSTKRKRDPSQEHEGLEQTSSPGVHTCRDTTRVTAPAHKKYLPALGSCVIHRSSSQSTRGSSTKKQRHRIPSSRKSSGTVLDDSSDSSDTETRPASKPPQPVMKRVKRALETAAREKPAFVDDDNEVDEKIRTPADEKTTAANGKKPKLAGSDPLFQLVWRWAGKELKRSIFFSNPFPDSEEYDLLPLDVYTEAARQVSKLACYKDAQSRATQEYNTDWSSSLTHRLSSLRAALKAHTVNEVRAHFKALGHNRRKALLDEDEYWYKLTANGEAVTNAPFMNPVLQSILRKGLFSGRAGLYKLFPEEFDGESDEKEVPAVLVALAATFAYMALDDYVNNSESISWNYNSPAVAKVYHNHLEELERIKSKKPTSYHALLRKFFSGCVGKVASASTGAAKKPKTDYQNLPDTFSD